MMNETLVTPLLRKYLLRHEDDIAQGINDYDDLRDIFKSVCGRYPDDTSNIGEDS